MCLVAFSLHLELLIRAPERWKIPNKSVLKKKKLIMKAIIIRYHQSYNHTASFFYLATHTDQYALYYCNHFSMADYMAAMSPKLQALYNIVSNMYFDQNKKLLIFINQPIIFWLIEYFLIIIDLYSVIKS